jgi:hypothetical protein
MNMSSDTTDTKAPSDTALHPGSLLDSGLRQLAERMQALFRDAIAQANAEVDDIVQNHDRDTRRIEHQLDHMLGFCCDPDMLLAYKRLCRHYFAIDPGATGGYIDAYREMWDTPDDDSEGHST